MSENVQERREQAHKAPFLIAVEGEYYLVKAQDAAGKWVQVGYAREARAAMDAYVALRDEWVAHGSKGMAVMVPCEECGGRGHYSERRYEPCEGRGCTGGQVEVEMIEEYER